MYDQFFNKYIQVALLGLVLFFVIQITKKIINKHIVTKAIEPHRRKIILNLIYALYYLFSLLSLLLILGIEIQEFAIFASSMMAVLGVGFFAQWSILSNLTASLILFFYHPMRIGDKIKILDKEYDLEGTVENITGFYVLLELEHDKRKITIPNNVILNKGIELLDKKYNETHVNSYLP